MPKLYDLIPDGEGYKFTNNAGDKYSVYITIYSLLDPENTEGPGYIEVYMLGFNCKRFDPKSAHRFDARTKGTILSIFNEFMNANPGEAFVFICDNTDGRARNRRITFGRWFTENNTDYERHHSHIKYGETHWYSSLIVKSNNPDKDEFLKAYKYTLKQTVIGSDAEEL